MGDAGAPAIAVERLDFRHPGGEFRLAVDALHVARGERVVLVGPSGSGKTTLLHLIAGILEAPPGASIVVDGVDLAGADPALRRRHRLGRIGLVFQEFELLDYLTVAENVALPLRLGVGAAGPGAGPAGERVAALAAATGISHRLGARPDRLSQGERQRTAICRALVTEPAVVLADEPTGNLDPANAAAVLDLLLEQVAVRDATLVMVTHDHTLLDRFDRVVRFADGTLTTTGGADR